MRQLTIDAYLDELSARIPAPGGGACAALHAAQAAALTAMVSRYSSGEKFAPHKAAIDRICAESDQLMRAAAELADDDAAAFGAVAAAYQLPWSDEQEKAKRSAAIAEGLEAAAQPPARIVAVSGRLVALAEELGPIGNRNVITDVAAAAEAARAAAVTARVNIEVNIAAMADTPARRELLAAAAHVDDIMRRADAVVSAVRAAIAR
jgi:methenyltetrahydrofolate cyclohydrolase